LKHTLFIDALAMSTICAIDEENLTEAGQDGTQQQTPPCLETSSHSEMKDSIMNSKFLYVATIAVSLLSTLAMADESVVSRSQVKAELSQAIADGTLQRTDYDADRRDAAPRSTQTRDRVLAEMAASKADRKRLKGPGFSRIRAFFFGSITRNTPLLIAGQPRFMVQFKRRSRVSASLRGIGECCATTDHPDRRRQPREPDGVGRVAARAIQSTRRKFRCKSVATGAAGPAA